MSGNDLSQLNGGVVAGEDDAVVGRQGKVVPFFEAIWRPGQIGSGDLCFVNVNAGGPKNFQREGFCAEGCFVAALRPEFASGQIGGRFYDRGVLRQEAHDGQGLPGCCVPICRDGQA
jgi:hypothetical protein